MVAFYNAADQELYKKYKFLPQEQYRLGLNLPVAPVGAPEGNQPFKPISDSFANSGGGDGFNQAGNMFGRGTAVNPVYGGNPITGGFDGGYGVDPVTGDLPGGGNIVDEFGTKGEVYSKGAFDNIKEEEEKKNFLSKMRASFRQKTENLPDWATKGLTAAGMITAPAVTLLGKIFGGSSGGDGGNYGIAGLTNQQKQQYNALASAGLLYNDSGIMKTADGKNFSAMDEEAYKDYFDSRVGITRGDTEINTLKDYEDYINELDPKTGLPLTTRSALRKGYLTNKIGLAAYRSRQGDDGFTDFTNITDPTVTSNIVDEVAITGGTNNEGSGGTPPGFGITATGNYTNQFDGGDPGQGQGSNDHDGGASADAQSDDAAGAGGYARGGRAGYFFGGRVNYKKGGRINFRGGGMDASSDDFGGGDTPGPGDTGGEGGNNPSDGSDTQFGGNNNNNGDNNNPPPINKISIIDKIRYNPIINNPLTRLVGRVGMYSVNPSLMGLDYRTASQLKGVYDKATDEVDEDDVTLNKYKQGGRVSFKNGGLASIL